MSTRHEVRARVACCPGDADDSDSAVGSGGGAGSGSGLSLGDGFRVRVSLERFFSDERSRVLMWAERARPAAWLVRRLRAAVPLPVPSGAALALRAAGCLLPPDEPLALLRPDELIEVIISPCGDGAGDATVDGEQVPPAVEDVTRDARGAEGELEAVKRRALLLLDEVAGDEGGPAPRRRRRARRRRAAGPGPWRAEPAAGAGVVRSASPPRAPRLVAADVADVADAR